MTIMSGKSLGLDSASRGVIAIDREEKAIPTMTTATSFALASVAQDTTAPLLPPLTA